MVRSFGGWFLALLVLVTGSASSADSPRPEELLAANTAIALIAEDPAKLLRDLEQTSFGRLFHDDELTNVVEEIKTFLDTEDMTAQIAKLGLSWDDLGDFLGQRIAIGLSAPTPEFSSSVIAVLDLGDQVEAFAETMEVWLETAQDEAAEQNIELLEEVEEFQDYSIHVIREVREDDFTPYLHWCIADGKYVASSEKTDIEEALTRLAEREFDDSLANEPNFLAARANAGPTNLFAYLSVSEILPDLAESMQKNLAAAGPASPIMAMGITADAILKSAGFDAVRGICLSLDATAGEVILDLGLHFEERRGLINIFAYESGDPPEHPFIPEATTGVSAGRYSIKKAWNGIEETMLGIIPMLGGLFQIQLQQILASADITRPIDLKNGLLTPLGDEFSIFTMRRESSDGEDNGTDDTVYGFSIKDRPALEIGLADLRDVAKAAADAFGMNLRVEDQDYLGTKIQRFVFPVLGGALEGAIHIAVTDRFLFASGESDSALRAALITLNGSGSSFWDRDEVKTALELLPSGASGLAFETTTASDLGTFLAALEPIIGKSMGEVDFDQLASSFGPTVWGFYPGEKSLTIRVRTQSPEKE